MANEKLDRIILAQRDYEAIKELHPSNLQASKGLNRIHQILLNSDEKKRYVKEAENEKSSDETHQSPAKSNLESGIKNTEQPKKEVVANINLKELQNKKEEINNFFKQS